MNFIGNVEETRFLEESSETHRRFTAIHLDFTADLAAGDKNLVILADTLNLAEDLLLPGRDLTILTRVLLTGTNRKIDVSGMSGPGQIPQKAANKKGPGGDGDHGVAGASGGNSGNVYICCQRLVGSLRVEANGGHGGKGQDGMDGNIGAIGDPGPDASTDPHNDFNGDVGGVGKLGGNYGAPGAGGQGGNSGTINIQISEPFDAANVTVSSVIGSGGDPGEKGNPGMGGPGGPGGRKKTCDELPGHEPS